MYKRQGELTLDKDYDTFEGETQWCGKDVSLSLEAVSYTHLKRNYYMVDHAEYIIGVFDNQKKLRSGTAQTVNYALHQGKVITLIHQMCIRDSHWLMCTVILKSWRPATWM